jgi:anti-anti-sigma regulatory factor
MSQAVEVVLPEQLTIQQVQRLHEQFERVLQDRDNDILVAQADNISRVDAAGLQLLWVAKREAQECNIKWEWRSPSLALVEGARLLGMTQVLSLDQL